MSTGKAKELSREAAEKFGFESTPLIVAEYAVTGADTLVFSQPQSPFDPDLIC